MDNRPVLSFDFAEVLARISETYQETVYWQEKEIVLAVDPGVFPPGAADHSVSSRLVYENFGDLNGKRVIDLGCGCGVLAIIAGLAGAKSVDAVDLNSQAVANTRRNVIHCGLERTIKVWQSDLFQKVPKEPYDLIIANLPIVNFTPPVTVPRSIAQALYDPGWQLHRRLLAEVRKGYLAPQGRITFTHADIISGDFERLEALLIEMGYAIVKKVSMVAIGYNWTNYTIRPA